MFCEKREGITSLVASTGTLTNRMRLKKRRGAGDAVGGEGSRWRERERRVGTVRDEPFRIQLRSPVPTARQKHDESSLLCGSVGLKTAAMSWVVSGRRVLGSSPRILLQRSFADVKKANHQKL